MRTESVTKETVYSFFLQLGTLQVLLNEVIRNGDVVFCVSIFQCGKIHIRATPTDVASGDRLLMTNFLYFSLTSHRGKHCNSLHQPPMQVQRTSLSNLSHTRTRATKVDIPLPHPPPATQPNIAPKLGLLRCPKSWPIFTKPYCITPFSLSQNTSLCRKYFHGPHQTTFKNS